MRRHWFLLALIAAILLALPCGARPARDGTIRGRVRPTATSRSTVAMAFLLDGAPVRPRLKKGAFSITHVPPGGHTLSVIDANGRGVHRRVTVRARAVSQLGSLTLAPGGQITGIVSRANAETGAPEPLGGVEVLAEPESPMEDGTVVPPVGPPLVAVTDESGAYQFRAVPPGGYRVSVVVPGLEAGVEFAWVEVGHTAVADFVLREAIEEGVGTVSGVVRGADGAVLEGVLVTISTLDYFPAGVTAESKVRAAERGKARRALPDSLPRGSFMTLTDQFGHYTLNVPSGNLWADVWMDGFIPQSGPLVVHPRESVSLDFALEPDVIVEPTSLRGTVTDAGGHALSHVRVTVELPFAGAESPLPWFSAVTNEHGEYQIEGVPAGTWSVNAMREGYQTATAKVVFAGNPITLDFTLNTAVVEHRRRR